jgi:hypothetical protein
MALASETGHAKNIANFKQLITTINSFGNKYQPIADFLQIEKLEQQAQNAQSVLAKLKEFETLEKQSIATLQEEFKTLGTFTSQLMGILISSGAKISSVEEARAVQKLIVGKSVKKKKIETTNTTIIEVKETRSTSRQSYDSRLDNFEKFITILQNIAEYKPKEDAFQINTLKNKLSAMKNAIAENDNRELARRQMMNERNSLLYADETGIVAVAIKVKEYIKAVFGGIKSTEYKSVSKISIRGVSK